MCTILLGCRFRQLRPVVLLTILFVILTPPGAHASVAYNWASAISGFADTPADWSPNGVPGAGDFLYWNVGGAYQTVFPADVSQTSSWTVYSGNLTLSMNSPHTTNQFYIGTSGKTSTVALGPGVLQGPTSDGLYLQLGANSSTNTLNVNGAGVSLTAVGFVGYGDGAATMNVTSAAHLQVGTTSLKIGTNYQGSGTLNIAGFNNVSRVHSSMQSVSTPDFLMSVGGSGTGALNIYNGGFAELGTALEVGSGVNGSGTLSVGPGSILLAGTSWLTLTGDLNVALAPPSNIGGHGEMSIDNHSFVTVGGKLYMGDPDEDFGHCLHMYSGSELTTNGFVVLPQTLAGSLPLLDFRGGLIHVHGGAFSWPAGAPLTISSQVGAPEMWVANSAAGQGPNAPGLSPQLIVGRGGSGVLRILRAGTMLTCGSGPTVLGDSTGSFGKVVVDSSGGYLTTGYTNVGNLGQGQFQVLNGGAATLGALHVGNGAVADTGTVLVRGTAARMTSHDVVDIGGNLSPGYFQVDSGATCSIVTSGIFDPPQCTVHSGTGFLTVTEGGKLTSTGAIENDGKLTIQYGEIDAPSLYSYGSIFGAGLIVANTTVAGSLKLFSELGLSSGALSVQGSYQQSSTGHLETTLGRSGVPVAYKLVVSGAATLAGTLNLDLDPSFIRVANDTFTVLLCGSRSGTFSAVTWNGSPLTDQVIIVYGPTSVKVVINPAALGIDPGAQVSNLRLVPLSESRALVFRLEMPQAAEIDVRLYDVMGREAARLASGSYSSGVHDLTLSDGGCGLASGAYFARAQVRTGDRIITLTAHSQLVR